MHYICTGECKGVSEKPQDCQERTCSKHGEALQPCGCKDGQHNHRQHIHPQRGGEKRL